MGGIPENDRILRQNGNQLLHFCRILLQNRPLPHAGHIAEQTNKLKIAGNDHQRVWNAIAHLTKKCCHFSFAKLNGVRDELLLSHQWIDDGPDANVIDTPIHHGQIDQIGTLEEILTGPAHENDGTLNLVGGLRSALATCGYESIQSFQKCEVMVAPALKTEGKKLQQAQAVGMG